MKPKSSRVLIDVVSSTAMYLVGVAITYGYYVLDLRLSGPEEALQHSFYVVGVLGVTLASIRAVFSQRKPSHDLRKTLYYSLADDHAVTDSLLSDSTGQFLRPNASVQVALSNLTSLVREQQTAIENIANVLGVLETRTAASVPPLGLQHLDEGAARLEDRARMLHELIRGQEEALKASDANLSSSLAGLASTNAYNLNALRDLAKQLDERVHRLELQIGHSHDLIEQALAARELEIDAHSRANRDLAQKMETLEQRIDQLLASSGPLELEGFDPWASEPTRADDSIFPLLWSPPRAAYNIRSTIAYPVVYRPASRLSQQELHRALWVATLLHDIGHTPFERAEMRREMRFTSLLPHGPLLWIDALKLLKDENEAKVVLWNVFADPSFQDALAMSIIHRLGER